VVVAKVVLAEIQQQPAQTALAAQVALARITRLERAQTRLTLAAVAAWA
jgi:hypothetical protein